MIQDATFLHVAVPDAIPGTAGQSVFAVHVRGDGQVDLPSSRTGIRVYGEWPNEAWLRVLTDAGAGTTAFYRWSGGAWAFDPVIGPRVIGLLPWRDHSILHVEGNTPHGTRVLVQSGNGHAGQLRVPPELERFDAAEIYTLPGAGMVVMTGQLEEQGSAAIVTGTKTAVLRNSVGSSAVTVSLPCGRILMSQWISGAAPDAEPRVRAVRIHDGAVEPGEDLPAEPQQFAIDRRCHEWFVSADGGLFEQVGPSKGWQRIDLGATGGRPEPSAVATLGDRVWVSIGSSLYVVHAGKAEKVELPVSVGPRGVSFFLGADEQADRLWVAVIPVNEKSGTILTTGPVPHKMQCVDLTQKLAHD